jgi:hypothetical protein
MVETRGVKSDRRKETAGEPLTRPLMLRNRSAHDGWTSNARAWHASAIKLLASVSQATTRDLYGRERSNSIVRYQRNGPYEVERGIILLMRLSLGRHAG